MKRTLPAVVRAELCRVAKVAQPWIVADMDSTLIRKARGEWPELNESSVRPHLVEWLRTGGALLVVTSDDGHRPWRALLRHIPEPLRDRVALSTADGAVLARLDEKTGKFSEDHSYWDSANYSETESCCNAGLPEHATEIACAIKRDFLSDAIHDPALLASISPDWRREEYSRILDRFRGDGLVDQEGLVEFLSTDNMLGMASIMQRGSLVWRNEAGAPEFWELGDAEWRSLRATQLKEQQQLSVEAKTAGIETNEVAPRWSNCFILGLSSAVSAPYIARHASSLAKLGAVACAAPNSVLIKNQATDKALPVRWFARNATMGFALASAVAFGDNPRENDGPLASFRGEGMPFVSVAAHAADTPPDLRDFHVGGLEQGTADCIAFMNEARAAADFDTKHAAL